MDGDVVEVLLPEEECHRNLTFRLIDNCSRKPQVILWKTDRGARLNPKAQSFHCDEVQYSYVLCQGEAYLFWNQGSEGAAPPLVVETIPGGQLDSNLTQQPTDGRCRSPCSPTLAHRESTELHTLMNWAEP